MLILNGKYHVQQNKRLTILAEAGHLPKGTLQSDIDALHDDCQTHGRCDVQVNTQHGLMHGTLVEKKPLKFSLWQFEGHLSFPARG
ncbi:hypothetical protein [Deinococcus malanensis]|uniref:hypothetical protein n=1 Tax=Deinococcus malanensis TaxID=1706855 RepID=UPI00166C8214|nr:hypothetical protein [Deinococcus malanensis]